ncbi:putative major facilitator superfamily protein [Diaporthe ampelina]|uniref:Putative major facilitator superfamily protein n=1 Tax=Diaporthe ampelina TaxID=1214573 RepID=A0A0G2HGF3_9PEZI|nr:putative major facilitator superfamily protein [Diaporthe ampelina]
MANLEKFDIETPFTGSEATIRPTSCEAVTDRVRQVSISSSPEPYGDLERQNTRLSVAETIRQKLGNRPECFKNTAQEVSFVTQATIAMASNPFLTGATSTVTATIGRELGMTQGQVSWIAASTTLAAGSFQLALGQLSDLLGRRMLFLWGMGSYAVFVLLVGFAQNPFWMDIVLGVLGVSSAMIVPPAGGILGAAYGRPSKRKNLAFSAFTSGKSLGTVAGSITCGIAARLFNWRASFYFIAILFALAFLHALWAVPSVEAFEPGEPLKQRLCAFARKFDALGAALILFGTGMFTAGITLGPEEGWTSPITIPLVLVGVALIVTFGYWETKCAHPLMPPFIWKDRNFALLSATTVFGYMSFQASSFYLAFFMQEIRGYDPLSVALHLLPQAIAGLLWNVLIGYTLHKVNNTLIIAAGSLSYLAANILLSLMRADSSYWAFMFPALILNVVGADFQTNVSNMYVMQCLPAHQQGLATGVQNTLNRLSATVGVGIATAIYSSVDTTAQGMALPMLKYTRTFEVSVGMAAVSVLFVPWLRLGTQGNQDDAATLVTEKKEVQPVADAGARSEGVM